VQNRLSALTVGLFFSVTACNQPVIEKPGTQVPLGISKLELAQTHVVPPEGKTWIGDKLAKYNLHMVGNREAIVLVDFVATSDPIANPIVEARVGGQKLGEVALGKPETFPKTEPGGGAAYSTTAYWAKLDKTWLKPGLELVVRADGGKVSMARAVKVGAPSAFTIYTLPFYLFGLNETNIPLSDTAAPDQVTRDEYFARHPFAELEMVNHPAKKVVWSYMIVEPREGRPAQKVEYKEQQGDGFAVMSAVLGVLGNIRRANGDGATNNHYYAPLLMANQAGKYEHPGGGLGGGDLGTGDYSYAEIFVHEAGHAYGMPHANDGYLSGNYPYIGGSLKGSSWGYDSNKNLFLSPLLPTNPDNICDAANPDHQHNDQGQCYRQDPMQGGSGDRIPGTKYSMFSDFNANVVQNYLEGTTTIKDGTHEYDGGRIFIDPSSSTGYKRWDSLDSKFVEFDTKTTSNGIYGLDQSFPIQRGVPVHSIVMTANIASIQDTFTEEPGKPKLSYQDTITYNNATTQIYAPLTYTGNLIRLIDPTKADQLASIVPDSSANPWYCKNAGCDYTLKATFADDSQQFVVLQTGFRGWFNPDINPEANDPKNGNSFRSWVVNVPATKQLKKLELLETPEIWKGLPANPKVIATRMVN
jgi:Peptidase M66